MERTRGAARGPGRGFTILELTIVLGILAMLVGLLVPGVSGSLRDGRAARILDLYGQVARASQAFYADTERLPIELGTSADLTPAAHQLSFDQDLRGWDGPYLAAPITPAANPRGGQVLLLDGTDSPLYASGPFDLVGDGNLTRGAAGVLVIAGIEETVAHRVDSAIDRDIPGPWPSAGRAKYAGGDLQILVFSPPRAVAQTPRPSAGGAAPDWWAQWWVRIGAGAASAPGDPAGGDGSNGQAKGKDKK